MSKLQQLLCKSIEYCNQVDRYLADLSVDLGRVPKDVFYIIAFAYSIHSIGYTSAFFSLFSLLSLIIDTIPGFSVRIIIIIIYLPYALFLFPIRIDPS